MNKQIIIGKSRIEEDGKRVRLCSDVTIDQETRTLFFGVEHPYGEALTKGRADPFLITLINYAMQSKRDVICEDPVSEMLLFSVRKIYTKALAFGTNVFFPVSVRAVPEPRPYPSRNAVGTGMSFGCDSLYTFMMNRNGSEYPIEYLCNFNNGVYGSGEDFNNHSAILSRFAAERSLKSVSVDTNLASAFPERFMSVCSQRNAACALALQGLFGTYLLSSGNRDDRLAQLGIDNGSLYDLLSTDCFNTERLKIRLSGSGTTRINKLRALSSFEDAQLFLHPCFCRPIGTMNCGRCKKDIRDMTLLYIWNVRERFTRVYDWTDFDKRLTLNLGVLLALSGSSLYSDTIEEYLRCGGKIPEASYRYAKAFAQSLERKKPSDDTPV